MFCYVCFYVAGTSKSMLFSLQNALPSKSLIISHVFLSLAIKLTTLSVQYGEMTHQHQQHSFYGVGLQTSYSKTTVDLWVSVHLRIPSQSHKTGKVSIAFGSKLYKGSCSPYSSNWFGEETRFSYSEQDSSRGFLLSGVLWQEKCCISVFWICIWAFKKRESWFSAVLKACGSHWLCSMHSLTRSDCLFVPKNDGSVFSFNISKSQWSIEFCS